MKKYFFIALAIVFSVTAAHAATLQPVDFSSTARSFDDTVNKASDLTDEQVFSIASKDAGFHIYYPTYLPPDLWLDRRIVWTKEKVNIPLFNKKSPVDTSLPMAAIKENPNNKKLSITPVMNRLAELTQKEQVTFKGVSGYFGIYPDLSDKLSFNTLLFSTPDSVDVEIWSASFGKDELIKIAESMFPATSTPVKAVVIDTKIKNGMCLVRGPQTAIPPLSASDIGSGYAKLVKKNKASLALIKSSCSKTDFTTLLNKYCKKNADPVQFEVAAANKSGEVVSHGCGRFGCNAVACPKKK